MASSPGEGRRSLLLSFSEEGKDGGDDGSGDGTKVGSSSFSSAVGRSVGWAYKRANRVLAKRLRSASSRVFAVLVCSLKNVSHPTLCPGQCGSLYSERGVGVDLMKQRCSDPS